MAGVTLTAALLLLASVGVFSENLSFKGYELLSVFTRNVEEAKNLFQLRETHVELDFWIHPAPGKNGTVLVPPRLLQEFKDVVSEQKMPFAVLSDDVQSLVDAGSRRTPEAIVSARMRSSGHVINHYDYHTYPEIQNYLSALRAKYPKHVRVSTLNRNTAEGRSVALVKLSGTSGDQKPAIIIEAGIHPREWISPASILWVMEKILGDYAAGDSSARLMLDKYDWYVIPVTNPDGYQYTHTGERLWRMNRRKITENCIGVNLNRNFDIAFGTVGFDHDCRLEGYCGPSAFSEAETSSIRDLFNSLHHRVVAYVAVHSFSQMILVPWGYSDTAPRPDNYVEVDRVTKLMTTAISRRHGKTYRQGPIPKLLAAVSGSSIDWALSRKPKLYSLAFELRPTPPRDAPVFQGFLLPSSEIIPTGEELHASLVVLAKEMRT